MAQHEIVLVLDFGGQYNQLIARRVRECNVYCEVKPYTISPEEIEKINPKGLIFTGGPNSVYLEDAPKCDDRIYSMGIPILGICYGAQLLAHSLGGNVASAPTREFGRTPITYEKDCPLFCGLPADGTVWMSHQDYVDKMPTGFLSGAHTINCPTGAFYNLESKIFGVQFHPEVLHTDNGTKIIDNFLFHVCHVSKDWSMKNYAKTSIENLKNTLGDKKVMLALSGGVDSSVAASLLSKACGKNLYCIFVDHGLMRKNEGNEIEKIFGNYNLNFVRVDAKDRFLSKLSGIIEPEEKRKIIGEEFIRVFEEEARKIGAVDYLAQGTIYPDVIESGLGDAAVIKSHHNVGGLPSVVDFKELIEPLRQLFKDEVRCLGRELGLPENLVSRQPFPGPGLAIRIIGEVTEDKLDILKDADLIFREELVSAGIAPDLGQYFAVLTSMKSVGVMGDFRTYDYTLALRAVTTSDFMTASWARIPYDILDKISVKIINEVKGINRIVYDITTKPPATIEWE